MPLDDATLNKICFGRIVLARVVNSFGNPTVAHWGVVMSGDEQIKSKGRFARS